MKKLLLLLVLACIVVFAGCSGDDAEPSKSKIRSSVSDSGEDQVPKDVESEEDYDTKDEAIDEEEVVEEAGSIDETFLADIGRDVASVEKVRGELAESFWSDGPIYRFGSCSAWYGFEEYEYVNDSQYSPKGECNVVSVPLREFLKDTDSYTIATLEKITGNKHWTDYSEMVGSKTFLIEYKDYIFCIYADTELDISGNSVVNVERK